MIEEYKTKWLEALRSGDYKQGRETLKKRSRDKGAGPRYCCLGVLGECIDKDFFSDSRDEADYIPTKNRYTFELDDEHLKKVGLDWVDQEYLMKANDLHNWSFNRIADYIEENL